MACGTCGGGEADGASPFQALAVALNTPAIIRNTVLTCRSVQKSFPEGSSGLMAWNLLQACGLPFQYSPALPSFVALLQGRLRVIPTSLMPQPADLFVCVNEQGVPVHLGFVGKTGDTREWFYAIDPHVPTAGDRAFCPYRYSVDTADRASRPVAFYLRCPTCAE
jgi:hypothetical protein